MKILQIANKFPYPARDGGSIATLSLARSLAGNGHEVTVLAMNTSKHFSDTASIPAELSAVIRFISVPVDTDIHIFHLVRNFLFSAWPYNAERFISAAFSKSLEGLLRETTFDVILLEGLYLAPYLPLIRRCSAAKVAMRAHNIEHEIWERTARQQQGPRRLYIRHLAGRIRRMEYRFLNQYDAVLPITGRDSDKLKEMGCHLPMQVVPTGIQAEEFVPDPSAMEFPSVFHIGALDWMPNQEGISWFLGNVWEKVLNQFPEVKFYLAGRNAPAHFRTLKDPNMIFLGEVSDAYALMNSKAVMIVPILSGSGMRIKIIEGMAMQKAIVTTSIGTEGISTSHGENILIADEPEGFASCVCALLADRVKCIQMGESARKFVIDHYDNRSITKALTVFFTKLLT